MGKKKIILDTNIYISAVAWGGNPDKIMQKAINGEYKIYLSVNQLKEIKRVLAYPRLKFTNQQQQDFLSFLYKLCIIIEPSEKVNVVKEDHDDNLVLEPAIDNKIDYIISGDNHLLNLKEFKGAKIIKATEFLDEVENVLPDSDKSNIRS
ncbi:putative toxin-antitoxin system toxin component, PIN family [Candidatus Woesearchaeota archaeon]|nr:putative toxin-antitoxin system toxin component, PIN family [Candidatus Woesearchaeota archaeon]